MVEYTHEHFYLHFKLFNAWLDHYQSKLFSLYLLWSLNLHEEKNRSLGVCSTKKLDFQRKTAAKFLFFYKRLRLFENHNLESGVGQTPPEASPMVMYSNPLYQYCIGDVFKSNVLFCVSDCVVCIRILMHGDVFKSNVLYRVGDSIVHTLL